MVKETAGSDSLQIKGVYLPEKKSRNRETHLNTPNSQGNAASRHEDNGSLSNKSSSKRSAGGATYHTNTPDALSKRKVDVVSINIFGAGRASASTLAKKQQKLVVDQQATAQTHQRNAPNHLFQLNSFKEQTQLPSSSAKQNYKKQSAAPNNYLGAYNLLGNAKGSTGKPTKAKKNAPELSQNSNEQRNEHASAKNSGKRRVETSGNQSENFLDRAAIQDTEGAANSTKN